MNIFRYISIAILICWTHTALAQRNATYDEYINQYKDLAIEQMKLHKIPASITLAQGILESGGGKSTLAIKAKNHFGIKCHTDWVGGRFYKDDDAANECFRVYKSVRDSYEDHSQFLLRSRYARLFTYDPLDYKAWAKGLKECGYATLPTYADRLINLIELYELYVYDTGKDGKHQHKPSANIASTINHGHQPYLVNDIVCYRAIAVDDWDILASELGVKKKKLLKYNECEDTYTQLEGMNVFIGKKKSKAAKQYKNYWHKVQRGESMYSISQLYGVRIKNLYKMNFKSVDYIPAEGDLLKVR